MIRSFSALIALVLLGGALAHAQEPRLVVPKLRGVNLDDASRPDPSKDVAKLYASPREAALAAFQAGYKSATAAEKRLERAMGLFLLSLRRDPTLAKALFNLGILCAQASRWSDAISFQSEFQMQSAVEPAWLKSSASEVERLKTIIQLDGTPEGKRRMQFDRDLGLVLKMTDPIPALNAVNRLAQRDKTFWEAPALAGIFHAETKAYSESAKFLAQAAGLAPSDRRANLELAADAARKEAAFADQVREAGIAWEKQQYETAAKAYQAAWKAIPTRLETGMQAATGFLMADHIWLATDERQKPYALRRMHERLRWNLLARRRFVRGAEILAKIGDHDRIIGYVEHGKIGGKLYLLMDYVEASNLKELYTQHDPVLVENVAQILIDMAEGLEHMHENGYMHLDFKPENVLVTRNASVRLVDFDLAQPIPEKPKKASGKNPGTPAYMAPEQLLGEPISHRADIFSYGRSEEHT